MFGRVVGLDGVDIDLYPGEVLAVIGDNGAGKSTLIKCLTGALVPDAGEHLRRRRAGPLPTAQDARDAGIETVYQTLAVAPALDIASNLYPGPRGPRAGLLGSVFRMLDKKGMRGAGRGAPIEIWASARCRTSTRPSRRCPAASARPWRWPAPPRSAARSWSSTSRRPRSASGRSTRCSKLDPASSATSGLAVILISHNMPHVFEVADRIHIQRLGRRAAVITPKTHTMADAVAIMTGAMSPE